MKDIIYTFCPLPSAFCLPPKADKDGFSVRIYPNDHLPSHVHVFKAEGEAKINQRK
ncbi:MAG: DUF4160 domain-containing protein [Tolypothrix carrinoi HA7290-LM1]|nr:DUF4160 domain-containing protein [Tolypothrix carrinoi HA7290-LM1]